ncbi:MAG: SRPBCC domain-containing protein [Bacteroidales bacterium]|jgi:activator of HSP90 ATPase|nr:SRPBCC domain-containing protein [Bacteroidales bacterium]
MKDFKFYTEIDALPTDVWTCLTNPLTIELWSGYKAEMSTNAGDEFSLWEGDICGKIVSATEPRELIQQWYFGDAVEESIAIIRIHPFKSDRCKVEVRHSNIPDEDYDNIVEGWREYYIGAIVDFLEE